MQSVEREASKWIKPLEFSFGWRQKGFNFFKSKKEIKHFTGLGGIYSGIIAEGLFIGIGEQEFEV